MIPGRPARYALLAAATLALVAGCAIEQRRVELPQGSNAHRYAPMACELRFGGVHEGRSRQRTRGPSWHIYDIDNAIDYLDAGIRSLIGTAPPTEEDFDPASAAVDAAPELQVELVRAYAQGKSMRGFYNVVMTARIGDQAQQVIRGRYDVTNWFGSRDEFATGMQRAMDDALGKMRDALAESPACGEQGTAS